MVNIVTKHKPRTYTALSTSNGIVLCDNDGGAFLVLRFKEDVERLRKLLEEIVILGTLSPFID